jgi:hypothetical protein
VRSQQQHPPAGSPPQAVWLQHTGRVVIPAPANDNAQSPLAGAAALAVVAALLVVTGWALIRLFG